MRNVFIYALMMFALSSCEEKKVRLKSIELRQLSTNTEIKKIGSAGFFLFIGSVSHSESESMYVRMCGNVDGSYRFLKFRIEDVRIKIYEEIDTPYIMLNVDDYMKDESASEILDRYPAAINSITIYCSNDMLPENLLPLDITSKN